MSKGRRPGIGRPTREGCGECSYPQAVSPFGISPDSWINLRFMESGASTVSLYSINQGQQDNGSEPVQPVGLALDTQTPPRGPTAP